jgi:GNAT superfamily N-acetyltransferase
MPSASEGLVEPIPVADSQVGAEVNVLEQPTDQEGNLIKPELPGQAAPLESLIEGPPDESGVVPLKDIGYLRTWDSGGGAPIQIRGYDHAPPETQDYGQLGRADLAIQDSYIDKDGYSHEDIRGRLTEIEVPPEHRGQGIGGAMLQQAEEAARQHGATEIYGDFSPERIEDADGLRAFYEGHGYEFRDKPGGGEEFFRRLDLPVTADEPAVGERVVQAEDHAPETSLPDQLQGETDRMAPQTGTLPPPVLDGEYDPTHQDPALAAEAGMHEVLEEPLEQVAPIAGVKEPPELTEAPVSPVDETGDKPAVPFPDEIQAEATRAAVERVGKPTDLDSKRCRERLYKDACGTLGEELCVRANEGISLDDEVKNNFPVYDVTGASEIASVKSHIVTGDVDSALGSYAVELREALGIKETGKVEKSVDALWDVKSNPEKWEALKNSLPGIS